MDTVLVALDKDSLLKIARKNSTFEQMSNEEVINRFKENIKTYFTEYIVEFEEK